MKKSIFLLIALLAIFVMGCDQPTGSDNGGGSGSGSLTISKVDYEEATLVSLGRPRVLKSITDKKNEDALSISLDNYLVQFQEFLGNDAIGLIWKNNAIYLSEEVSITEAQLDAALEHYNSNNGSGADLAGWSYEDSTLILKELLGVIIN